MCGVLACLLSVLINVLFKELFVYFICLECFAFLDVCAPCACLSSWGWEEDVESPGAGVTGGCEPSEMDAGIQTLALENILITKISSQPL